MSITEKALDVLEDCVIDKDVLEVACGSADLSVTLSSVARTVNCIDLVDFLLNPEVGKRLNVKFSLMDAAQMSFADSSFDTVVIYNAAYHIKDKLDRILSECLRVAKQGGAVCVISSFSIDKAIIERDVATTLNELDAHYELLYDKTFTCVKISV